MPFDKEQAIEIKKQLLDQVEKLPNENREQIKQHIHSLNDEQLEEFLIQNNIQISPTDTPTDNKEPTVNKPIFELIAKKEIPSFVINENKDAIAVLEINPLSIGHTIIIPKIKSTVEKIPKSALSLAQNVAKKIKLKLKPIDIKIETFSFQEYPAIMVIPIYKDMPKERKKASEEELQKIQSKLIVKKRPQKIKKSTSEKSLKELPQRIPY